MAAPFTISILWEWNGVKGSTEVFQAANNEFLRRIKDKTELWKRLSHNVLEPAVAENFASEGGEVGGWADLSDATIKKRVREGYGEGPILENRGRLRDSFYEGEEGHIEEFSLEGGEWGTEVQDDRGRGYSAYHQSGTGVMPRREILFWNERLSQATEAETAKFVADAAKGVYEVS